MLTVRCKSSPPVPPTLPPPLLTATVPTEDPSCPFSDFHSESLKKKKMKRKREQVDACKCDKLCQTN